MWLVRHGESTWNALGLVQGQSPDPGLTRRGRAQARRSARRLAGRPVAALYSSDLRRALETAGPISSSLGLDVVVDARLRERNLGDLEGGPSERLVSALSGIDGGRVVDPDAAPTGGESVRQLVARVAGFLEQLPGTLPPGDVVLVVHGGVVRACLAHLDGVAPEAMTWGPVGNGETLARRLGGSFAQGGQGPGSITAAAAVPSSSPSEDPT